MQDDATITTLPEAIPFEGLTKDQMYAHIDQHHQGARRPYHLSSKSTKDDLAKWHGSLHKDTNLPATHRHTELSVAGASYDHTTQSLNLEKPLTKAEATTLTQLINNDFDALAAEMRAMAADARREALEQWDRDHALSKDEQRRFYTAMNDLIHRFRNETVELQIEAGTAGFELKSSVRFDSTSVSCEESDRQSKRQAATLQIDQDLKRAELALDRQRLTAQRQILMSTITPEATTILNTIPSAQTLMLDAARARAAVQIDA